MDYPQCLVALLLSLSVVLLRSPPAITVAAHNDTGVHKNYLIILRKPYEYDRHVYKNVSSWHASLLSSVCDTAREKLAADPSAVTRLIYSYRNVVNGFSARLTSQEVDEMSRKDWFLKALPEKTYKLMTTHTPAMMGLTAGGGGGGRGGGSRGGLWNKTNMGEGIVIGVLDGGLAAGHPSLDGTGMPPPPAKWKGRCDFNSSVCNNKLIGARSFYESAKWKWRGIDDPVLPINESSHGTHTSTTAAGAFVPGASVAGSGFGTAAGMAPRAHLAFYQVCFEDKGCDRDDVLAAIDDAVEEGVDVLSISLGDDEAGEFSTDPVSLGGYTAIMRGVFVSTSAGNNGPKQGTVSNEAPWLLTVAAATTDRSFLAVVKLGNGVEINGEALYQPSNYPRGQQPMVRDNGDGTCSDASFMTAPNVAGKMVVCYVGGNFSSLEKGGMLRKAGAAGAVFVIAEFAGSVIQTLAHELPASQITYADGKKMKAYMNSTKSPTAELIFKGTVLGNPSSPVMAHFSSRGPSKQNQGGILKPDIVGPGVSIIAGVPKPDGHAPLPDAMAAKFGSMSGTSMACPHLSGIAALIKKAHPTWSPAAIKSALMTTADTRDRRRRPISDHDGAAAGQFALGAGFVNPVKAMNPGLVYNLTARDYVPFLCGLGYNNHEVNSIIHPAPPVSCRRLAIVEQKDLNYPTITVVLDREPYAVNVSRAVTNVGRGGGVYVAKVEMPKVVSVTVTPGTLRFEAVNQVKTFTVTISRAPGKTKNAGAIAGTGVVEGHLKWFSPKNDVRSPILVSFRKLVQANTTSADDHHQGH